jgi:hypothetical protein
LSICFTVNGNLETVLQDAWDVGIWAEVFHPETHSLMNLAYRPPSLPHRLGCHGDGVVVIVVNVGNCVACLADPERSEMSVDRRVQQ